MIRIEPPSCSLCNKKARYVMESWPVFLCHECHMLVTTWLVTHECWDNPIGKELVIGTEQLMSPEWGYYIWCRSPDHPMAGRSHWLKFTESTNSD